METDSWTVKVQRRRLLGYEGADGQQRSLWHSALSDSRPWSVQDLQHFLSENHRGTRCTAPVFFRLPTNIRHRVSYVGMVSDSPGLIDKLVAEVQGAESQHLRWIEAMVMTYSAMQPGSGHEHDAIWDPFHKKTSEGSIEADFRIPEAMKRRKVNEPLADIDEEVLEVIKERRRVRDREAEAKTERRMAWLGWGGKKGRGKGRGRGY